MRKSILLLAAIALAATLGTGQAAEVQAMASCKRTAGPSGFPPQVTGSCQSPKFSVGGLTHIAITLNPTPGFTGPLKAYVFSLTGGGGFAVSGYYVGGQLVYGEGSKVGPIAQGDWYLRVETKNTLTNPYQIPGTPGVLGVTDTAFGEFAATVTQAVGGTVE